MAYPPISNLPSPPSRQDPANFADEADAFLGALPTFQSETNAAGTYIDGKAAEVEVNAATASAAATTAVNAVDASEWTSGGSFTEGAVVWSSVSYQTYRAKTTHSGVTTDPSLDTTNWQVISSGAVTPAGATLEAVASGTLPNGSPVVINTDGTVSAVTGSNQELSSGVVFESAAVTFPSTIFDSNLNKVVIAYSDGGNSSFGTAIVGTVSGTSISFGTPVVFRSAVTTEVSTTFDSNLNKVVIAYSDGGNSYFGTAIVGTVSGTSISFGTAVVFESASVSATNTSVTFDSNLNKVVIAYRDVGNSNFGTAVVFKPEETNLGVFNFIGLSSGSYTDTQTATVQLISAVNEAQSGLTTAARYFVQTDGTLSTTAGAPEVYAGLAVSATKIIVKG